LGELEGKVAPIMQGLAADSIAVIEPQSQRLLAQWFFKTGLMVATSMDHEASRLPTQHYRDLVGSYDLPPASAVWIGRLNLPVHEAALWIQRFQWWDKHLDNPEPHDGYVFVLGIATIAAVVAVLDMRQSPESRDFDNAFVLGGLSQGRFLKLWPASSHYSQKWPPPMSLAGTDVKATADSFQRMGTMPPLRTQP
jgi:hypothetical protein